MGNLLEVNDLGFKRSSKDKYLFENISFSLKAGEKIAVYGGAGSGKTVFVEMISGLIKPTTGTIQRQGIPAVVTQKFTLYEDLTVTENLDFICTINGYETKTREEVLRNTALTGWENTRAAKLPVGLKKMLQYACAVLMDFSFLLIDEPTAGLDDNLQSLAWNLINGVVRKGKSVLFFTPLVSDAAHCERVYRLTQANFVHEMDYVDIKNSKKVGVGG